MSPTLSYRAIAALLCIVSCSRTPSRSAVSDSTRAADSAMAAGVPGSPSPDTTSTPSAQPAQPSVTDTAHTTKPAAPTKPAKPAAKPSTRSADTGQSSAKPTESASGSTPQPAADAPLRDAYHTAPLDTVDAKTYQGWKLFNLNCARCHGEDVSGTTIAPHLIVSLKSNGPIPDEATFQTTVCGGRVPKGMPSWCAQGMTPATIDTIYAYVKGRSDAKIHPGRPARKS